MAFWQTNNPVKAYIAALQRWVGTPTTGVWDAATHTAFYRKMVEFNPDLDPKTSWGSEPDRTAEFASTILDEVTDDESFSSIRPFLAALDLPIMNLADAQAWYGGLDDTDQEAITQAKAGVAEAVRAAESVPLGTVNVTDPAAAPPPGKPPATPATPATPAAPATPPATPLVPATTGTPTPPQGATGMSTKAKWALGIALALAAAATVTAIVVAVKSKKDDEEEAMGGCGCGG